MSVIPEEVARLVAPMLQKRVYIVQSRLTGGAERLQSLLADHLRYLIELERQGVLFASGPHFDPAGALLGDSLTVLRVESLEEARAVADDDPLHRAGVREYEVKGWQINEGVLELRVSLSSGTYELA